jgi:hypothetical protein
LPCMIPFFIVTLMHTPPLMFLASHYGRFDGMADKMAE